ncbi:hypothetical protein HMPREF9999_00400 [Alloprevotella sp. oral taxon 473 str. F0040]|nr:hypothetical protein HMPREF9999_00400 [Alloprevotella sp. oral taxon 473 str. F0040]
MLVSHGYLSLRNEHCCAKLLPVKGETPKSIIAFLGIFTSH